MFVQGSCHCKTYSYTLQLPEEWRPRKCNAAICRKTGALWTTAPTKDSFSEDGNSSSLKCYSFAGKNWSYDFCGVCGCMIRCASTKDGWPFFINAQTFDDVDLQTKGTDFVDGKEDGAPYVPQRFSEDLLVGKASKKDLETRYGSCHCGGCTYAVTMLRFGRQDLRVSDKWTKYAIEGIPLEMQSQIKLSCSSMGKYAIPEGKQLMFCSNCSVAILVQSGDDSDDVFLNTRTLDVTDWETEIEVRKHEKHK